MTDNEAIVLNRLKFPCIDAGRKYHILPSVLAALAIYESDWITNTDCAISNNLYLVPATIYHVGKVYSKYKHKVYKDRSQYSGNKDNLYKAYGAIDDSVSDYAKILINERRSPNGPYKYYFLREERDSTKCIDMLARAGYITDHLGKTFEDSSIPIHIKGIILKYELFLWDKEEI